VKHCNVGKKGLLLLDPEMRIGFRVLFSRAEGEVSLMMMQEALPSIKSFFANCVVHRSLPEFCRSHDDCFYVSRQPHNRFASRLRGAHRQGRLCRAATSGGLPDRTESKNVECCLITYLYLEWYCAKKLARRDLSKAAKQWWTWQGNGHTVCVSR